MYVSITNRESGRNDSEIREHLQRENMVSKKKGGGNERQRPCHAFKSAEIEGRGDCSSSVYIQYVRQVKGVILKMCWAVK